MLRPMTEQDREVFIRLADEFYHSSACLHTVPTEYFHKTLDEILADSPYAKGYIFEKDGKVAGYALLSFTYSNEAGGLACLLEEAYVIPEFQGCGLGRALCLRGEGISRCTAFPLGGDPLQRTGDFALPPPGLRRAGLYPND